MVMRIPNTIVKYSGGENPGFYIFVRDQFSVYQKIEALSESHHGQAPNFYVLDSAVPAGLTITGVGTGNTYLIRSTLAHNITINDTNSPTVIGNTDSSATVTLNDTPLSSTEGDEDFDFDASLAIFNLHIGDIVAENSTVNVVVGRIPAVALSGGTGDPVTYGFSVLGNSHSADFSIDSESGVITYIGGTLAVGDNVQLTVGTHDGVVHQHLGNVKVNVTSDHAPVLGNPQIAVDRGFKGDVTLTIADLNYSDADTDTTVVDANIIYTVKHLPEADAVVIKNDGDALAVDGTFTQQDVIDGKVVLTIDETKSLAGFALSVSNGSTKSSSVHDFAILTRAEIHIGDADANNTIDLSTYPDLHYTINSGDGRDDIKTSDGDDVITAGRGDDKIALGDENGTGGRDTIIYEYDARNKVALDGGDSITDFRRGEDTFTLTTKTFAEATEVEILEQVSGTNKESFADDQFIIMPDLNFAGDTATVSGIIIVFRHSSVISTGRLSSNSVRIEFDEAMTWNEFLAAIEYNGDENFDYNHLAIKSAVVLPALLGQSDSDLVRNFVTHIEVSDAVVSFDEGVIADKNLATLKIVNSPENTDFKYKLNDEENFKIVGDKLVLKAADYDADAKDSYTVVITAVTDDEAEDALEEVSFTVTINDLNDEAPVITSGAAGPVSDEYTYVAGDDVVYTAQGTPDAGGTITWSLKDNGATDDAGLFNIDETSGEVTFKAAATDAQRTLATGEGYSFTIIADANAGDGKTTEREVTLTATDLNDAPTEITLTRTALVKGSDLVGTLATVDADNDNSGVTETNTYEVTGGDDEALFEATGDQLNFIGDLAERKTGGETYNVEVTVTNTRGEEIKTYTQALSITEGAIYIQTSVDGQEYYSNYQDAGDGATDKPEGLLAENANGSDTAVEIGILKVNGGGTPSLILHALDNHEFTLTGDVLSYTGTDSGNFESETNYKTIKVTFSDNGTNRTEDYRIYLSDVNEAPSAALGTDSSDGVITTDDNHAVDTNTKTASAADADSDADLTETGNNVVFITPEMITVSDPDDHDNDGDAVDSAQISVKLISTQNGSIYVDGVLVEDDATITYADWIAAGNVHFVRDDGVEQFGVTADGYKDSNDPKPTSFTVEFIDAGTAKSEQYTFDLDVTGTNDAPVEAGDNDLNTDFQGGTVTLYEGDLKFTDVDNVRSEVIYTIVTAPTVGTLKKATGAGDDGNFGTSDDVTVDLAAGDTFTQQDIATDKISYTHDDTEHFTANFTYRVSNNGGKYASSDGNAATSESDNGVFTLAINVTNVDDAPTLGTISNGSVTENAETVVTAGNLTVSDPDADDPFATLNFYATAGANPHNPSNTSTAISKTNGATTVIEGKYGDFTFTYTASTADEEGSVSLSYKLDNEDYDTNSLFEDQTVSDIVRIRVYDDEAYTASQSTKSFTVNITGKNDAPEFRPITAAHGSDFTVSEDSNDDVVRVSFLDIVDLDSSSSSAKIYYTIKNANGISDPDSDSSELTSLANAVDVAGLYGTFRLGGDSNHAWTYTLNNDNTNVNELNNGQTLTDEIRFIVYDGSNEKSEVQKAAIIIEGHTDVAVVLSASSETATIDENNKGDDAPTGIVISTILGGLDVVTANNFDITGDNSTDFEIVAGTDENADKFILRAKAGMIDYDAGETTYTLTITATGSNGLQSAPITATITITDINDEAPVITSGDTGYISSGQLHGVGDVLYTAEATADTDDAQINWTLVNAGGAVGPFVIDGQSGAVTFDVARTPVAATYTVTITADAGDDQTAEKVVTLEVRDLNDAPTAITLTSTALDPDSDIIGILGTADIDTVDEADTYQVTGGADMALFEVMPDSDPNDDINDPKLVFKTGGTRKASGETYDVEITVTNVHPTDPTATKTQTYTQTFSITEGSLYILLSDDSTEYYSNYQDAGDGATDKPEGLLVENAVTGTVIGDLKVKGDTSLITGLTAAADDNNNGEFSLVGGVLSYIGTDSGNFESDANNKTIEVSITDNRGTSDPSDNITRTEKYTIYLKDVNEAPSAALGADSSNAGGIPSSGVITTDDNHAVDTDTKTAAAADADSNADLTETGNNVVFITPEMITVSDPDDHDNDGNAVDSAQISVKLLSTQNGSIYVDGAEINNDTIITYADWIAAGNVHFKHDGGEQFGVTADGYKDPDDARPTSFTVEFIDAGEAKSEQYTFELDVAPTNDAPVKVDSADNAADDNEGNTVTLTEGDLKFTDVDHVRGEVIYTIVTAPTVGTLRKTIKDPDGNPLTDDETTVDLVSATDATANSANSTFTQQDIAEGNIIYMHNGNEVFTDDFTYRVSDGGGKYASSDENAATNESDNGVFTFDITVTPVNDAPVLDALTENASETKDGVIEDDQGGGNDTLTLADLVINDDDENSSFNNYEFYFTLGDNLDELADPTPQNSIKVIKGGTKNVEGKYGDFKFTHTVEENGVAGGVAISYTLNNGDPDTNALNADEVVRDYVKVIADEDGDASKVVSYGVKITGTNDAPELKALTTEIGSDFILTEDSSDSTVIGAVLDISDVDSGDIVGGAGTDGNIRIYYLINSNFVDEDSPELIKGSDEVEVDGVYGTFKFTRGADGSDPKWTYELDNYNATINALDDGEAVNESFNFIVYDDSGAKSDVKGRVIRIDGNTDKPPVLEALASDVNELKTSVTEAGYDGAGAATYALANLDVSDPDDTFADFSFYAVAAGDLASPDDLDDPTDDLTAFTANGVTAIEGKYGHFNFTHTTDNGGSVAVSYVLNNADDDTNALGTNDTATDTVKVRVYDVDGVDADGFPSEVRDFTVNITGANDAPELKEIEAESGSDFSVTEDDADDAVAVGKALVIDDPDDDISNINIYYTVDGSNPDNSLLGLGNETRMVDGKYGTFELVRTNDGAPTWTYTLDNNNEALIDFNADDLVLTEKIRFIAYDDEGAKSEIQEASIIIKGHTDVAASLTISPNTATIDENNRGDAIATGIVITTTLDGLDVVTANDFDITGDNSADFEIVDGTDENADKFILRAKAGMIDYDAGETTYSLTITATGSNGLQSAPITATITITDINDEAPVIDSAAAGPVSDEYTYVAGDVVYTAQGTPDLEGGTITWSLKDNGTTDNAGLFNIDETSGEVTFKAAATEAQRTLATDEGYSFTIIADAGDQMAEKVVTLTATDLNDAPTAVTLTSTALTLDSDLAGTLATVDADNDNSGVTETNSYEVTGGDDEALFEITGDQLSIKSNVTRKAAGETYNVEVTVTNTRDSEIKTYTQAFSITEGSLYILILNDSTEYYSNYQDAGDGATDKPEGLLAENANGSTAIGGLNVKGSGSSITGLAAAADDNNNDEFSLIGGLLSYTGADSGDFESDANYKIIQVNIADNGTDRTEKYRIYLSDVNEAPSAALGTDSSNGVITTDDNHAVDTNTKTASAADADSDADLTETGNNVIFLTPEMITVSDPDDHDNDGDAVDSAQISVKLISTQNGSIYVDGVLVEDDATITYADWIAAGNVHFVRDDGVEQFGVTADGYKDSNDPKPTSFTVEFIDAGTAKSEQYTFDLDVTGTNDAPVEAGDNDLNTDLQGGTVTLYEGDLKFTDVDNVRSEVIYTIVKAPVDGILKKLTAGDDGDFGTNDDVTVDLAAGDTFTQQDIATDKISYTHDNTENFEDTLEYSVSNGGDTPVSETFTLAINVTNINDAPTLGTISPGSATENAETVVTAANLVPRDSDADDLFATLDFYATAGEAPHDPTNASTAISKINGATTVIEGKYGDFTFTYTTTVGVTDGSVALSYKLDNEDDDTNALTEDQKVSDTVRIRVYDDGGFSSEIKDFTVNITGKNDAPELADSNAVTVSEGGTATFTAANLQFTDPDSDDAMIIYTVESLSDSPAGTLKKATGADDDVTVDLVVGSTFTQQDIAEGNVRYTHDGTENHTDSFTYSVSNGGGTDKAVNTDATNIFTLSIAVTNANDAPVLGAIALDTTITGNDFTVTDDDENDNIAVGAVLSVTDVDANDNVNNMKIYYTFDGSDPDSVSSELLNGGETAGKYGTFKFTRNGDGSAPKWSYELDDDNADVNALDTIKTLTEEIKFIVYDSSGAKSNIENQEITIRGANDVPELANSAVTVAEDGAVTLTAANLQFTDAEGDAVTYTVKTLASGGTLAKDGAALEENATFTQQDVTDGKISYTHNGGEDATDSFTYSVSDGTAIVDNQTFTITVTNVNDAPVLGAIVAETNSDFTVTEDDANDNAAQSAILDITDADTDDSVSNMKIYYTIDGSAPDNDSSNDSSIELLNNVSVAGKYGTFNLTRDSNGTDPKWSYVLDDDNAEVNALGDNSDPLTEEIRFIVYDDEGAKSDIQSQEITIQGANDAPELANSAVTLAEGSAVILTANHLQFTDVEGDAITYTIVTVPSVGTLKKATGAGVDENFGTSDDVTDDLAAGGTFTQQDIADGKISYTHNGGEDASDSFTYSVSDGAAIVNNQTFAITVTDVNDAPVLANSAVTLAEGDRVTLTAANLQFTDVEGDAITYTIVKVPNVGTLKKATDAGDDGNFGTNDDVTVDLADGGTFTQQDIADGKISYTHNGDEDATDSFTYSVSDGTAIVDNQSFAITVTDVNDAPVLASVNDNADNAFDAIEGAEVTLTEADLQFTDVDNIRSEIVYKIVSAASVGSLKKGGVLLAENNTFTQQDIFAGTITYLHDGSENLSSNFTYSVSNGEGTDSTSTFTFYIAVQDVDDAPVLAPLSKNEDEGKTGVVEGDTASTFKLANLSVQDDDDSFNDITFYATAGASPVAPTATVNSTEISLGTGSDTVTTTVTGTYGRFTFSHTLGAPGTVEVFYSLHSEFPATNALNADDVVHDVIRVIAYDGEKSSNISHYAVEVTGANDAPVSANNAAEVAEGGTVTLTANDLQFTDVDNDPIEIVYTINTAATNGTLKKATGAGTDGVFGTSDDVTDDLAADGTFTQQDIADGKITYAHNGGENASDSFTYSVFDGAAAIENQTFTITVTDVNDAPELKAITLDSTVDGNDLNVTEDDAGDNVVNISDLDITDAEDSFDALRFYATAAGDSVDLVHLADPTDDLAAFTTGGVTAIAGKYGHFNFTHTAGENGSVAVSYVLDNTDPDTNALGANDTATDTVKVRVYDADGIGSSVQDFTVNIIGANDALVLTGDNALSVGRNTTKTLTAVDLGSTDVDTADSEITYTILTFPVNGTLQGVNSTIFNNTFTLDDIVNLRISYVHGGGTSTSDSFTYRVSDGTTPTEVQTFNITVIEANTKSDKAGDNAVTLNVNDTVTLTEDDLNFTDVDGDTITYVLISSVGYGRLQKDGSSLTGGGSFTQQDVADGKITYTHLDGTSTGDSFVYSVWDGTVATADQTFTITVTHVPIKVAGDDAVTVAEGATIQLTVADLQFTDVDNDPIEIVYTIETAATNGDLILLKDDILTMLGAGDTFTQQDIANGKISYRHKGGENESDSFTYSVSDKTDTTEEQSFDIIVTPDNDAPVLTGDNEVSVGRNTTKILTAVDLGSTDAENADGQITYTLKTVTANGSLQKDGEALEQNDMFTMDDVATGKIAYAHSGGIDTTNNFTYSVSDGEKNTGDQTFTITVIDANTAPVKVEAADNAVALNVSDTVTLTENDLQFTDVDGDAITYTVKTLASGGTLAKDGVALEMDDIFTHQDIADGKITYVHAGGSDTSDSFTYSVSDGTDTATGGDFTFNITVTHAPVKIAGDAAVTVAEEATIQLTAADLQFTDADNDPIEIVYTILTEPTVGMLKKATDAGDDGNFGTSDDVTVDLAEGATFTQQDIADSKISYKHAGDENTSDSFTYSVSDGTEITAEQSFDIIVTPVNDTPVLTGDNALSVGRNTTKTLTAVDLGSTDAENADGDITYTVVTAAVGGNLQKDGATLEAGNTFTMDDVAAGKIAYVHNDGIDTTDSFTYSVSDSEKNTGDQIFTITVIATNTAPVKDDDADNAVVLAEGGTVTLTADDLLFTDVDGDTITYTVKTLASGGTLAKDEVALEMNDTFTQQDIAAGKIIYVHAGGEDVTDSFTYSVSDGTAIVDNQSFAITLTPVNDAPALNAITAELGSNFTVTEDDANDNVAQSAVLDITDVDPTDDLTNLKIYYNLNSSDNPDSNSSEWVGAAEAVEVVGTYGTFKLNRQVDGNNPKWSYELDNENADVKALNTGDTLTEEIKFIVYDSSGAKSNIEGQEIAIQGVNVPVLTLDKTSITLDEGNQSDVTVATISIFDGDLADYTLLLEGGDADSFAILDGGTSLKLVSGTVLEADGDNPKTEYVVIVKAVNSTNAADNQTTTFTLTVNDINDIAPVVNPIDAVTVSENKMEAIVTATTTKDDAATTLTYTLGGDDASLFTIDDNGVVAAKDRLSVDDDDDGTVYNITVTATTDAGLTTQLVSDEVAVAITVIDGLDITSDATVSLAENTTFGTTDAVYTAEADATAVWSLKDDSDFDINSSTGEVTFKAATTLDDDTIPTYSFTVVATLSGESTSQLVTVTVADGLDITSDSIVGIAAGKVFADGEEFYKASSDDATATWGLSGTNANLFDIDAATGSVTIKTGTTVSATDSYSFIVTATIPGDGGDSASQTIALRGVTPSFTLPADTFGTATAGDDILNNNAGTTAAVIQGGDGDDTITAGSGGGVIAAGRGGDTVTLAPPPPPPSDDDDVVDKGADVVVARFIDDNGLDYTDGWQLYDGDLTINNFERGVDKLVLVDISPFDPVEDLNDFLNRDFDHAIDSDDDTNTTFIVTVNENNKIVSLEITFAHEGSNAGGDAATGKTVTVNFEENSRQDFVPGEFNSSDTNEYVLKDKGYLDNLFGGGDYFDVIDAAALSVTGLDIA